MRKLNVLIAGSTGYIGVQLVNLLAKHKNVKIKYLCGNTSRGKKISFFDKSLKSKKLSCYATDVISNEQRDTSKNSLIRFSKKK